jgi:hypothetical protein
MPARVHFTHHLCRVADPRTPYTTYDLSAYWRDWGGGERSHHFSYCSYDCGWGTKKPTLVSTEPSAVTCRACVRRLQTEHGHWKRQHAEDQRSGHRLTWVHWASDEEIIMRAWVGCCKARGVPCPRGIAEGLRIERAARALRIEDLAASTIVAGFFLGALGDSPDQRRTVLAEVEKLAPVDRELAAPVVAELLAAADALNEAGRRLRIARTIASQVATRVRSHALVAVPVAVPEVA